jgi:hypothetical protein
MHSFRLCEAGDVHIMVRIGFGINAYVLKGAALLPKYEEVLGRHSAR